MNDHNRVIILDPDVPDVAGLAESKPGDLALWASMYLTTQVNSSPRTLRAQISDLRRFCEWFVVTTGSRHPDAWTRSVTESYQRWLIGRKHRGQPMKPTTVNRYIATVRTFGQWLQATRPLLAGNPTEGVKDLSIDLPSWRGLTDIELTRLRSAVDQLCAIKKKANQYPTRDAAIFYLLLGTGLRAGELCALAVEQYNGRRLQNVRRKGKRVSTSVPVPKFARQWLDRYLSEERPLITSYAEIRSNPGFIPVFGPLFLSRWGTQLRTTYIGRITKAIADQANARLSEQEKIKLTPHMLRHTFLRKIAEKHGVHVAHRLSGNVSITQIFRYTKPSDEQAEQYAEELFE